MIDVFDDDNDTYDFEDEQGSLFDTVEEHKEVYDDEVENVVIPETSIHEINSIDMAISLGLAEEIEELEREREVEDCIDYELDEEVVEKRSVFDEKTVDVPRGVKFEKKPPPGHFMEFARQIIFKNKGM